MMDEQPIDIALGLPGPLPRGENVLWHGKPEARALARYLFRWPLITAYFGIFALLPVLTTAQAGASVAQIALSPLLLLPFAIPVAVGIMVSVWLLARTSTYVVTDKRVVLQVGVAFTRTINIPLTLIADVSERERAYGVDLALTLRKPNKIAWLAVWPHARSAHLSDPKPMMRGLPPESPAAKILVDAVMRAAPGIRHAPSGDRNAAMAIDAATSPAPQHV